MREHLAYLAAAVCRAMETRYRPGEDDRLDALTRSLRTDYGPLPGFGATSPAELVLDDDDRLHGLAEVFALGSRDLLLIAVAAAADLDANLGIAFGALSGRESSTRPSVGIGLELVGTPTASAEAFDLLGPYAPLRAARLVETVGDGPWLTRDLRVPDRIAAYLVGDDAPDPIAAAMAVSAASFPVEASTELARGLAARAGLVWIRSPLGTAGRATAVGALEALGIGALTVDARRAPAGIVLLEALLVAAREAALVGRGLVVINLDVLAGVDAPAVADALWRAVVPVVGVGRSGFDPSWLEHPVLTVDARSLTPAEREQRWTALLGDVTGDGRAALIGLRLTPEDITEAAALARLLAVARDEPVTISIVREAARALGSGAGAPGPRNPGARATISDLVLPEHVIDEVHRLIRWATYRDEVLSRGAVQGKGGKGTGIAALFTGGSGTGKTLAANVIAEELGLELMQVDLSSVIDKYIGETEKNLERIFHQAESRNVVLFFDEADALFGSRSEVRDARDRYANQEVSYLLQRMEHYEGITVLATNLRGNLDQAFTRRMQFILHFPDPDQETRARLWTQHLAAVGETDPGDPIDVDLLARAVELSGGDIRNIVLGATYDAVSDGEHVGMQHIRTATVREYAKLGRRTPEALSG